ncbi:MFS transporter [Francisella tularensis subsp. novicida]|uniref:Lysosomal dipeptide transporter MFSD1 n=3 Tax=Francisella tularensis TaxID=263 RepID=A0A6I4RT51_FRATU|nr:MFS transporter [Francisella tularensis]ABK90512.1 major facilitator superfamily (MFS) transport protein [Francisella tularensis subsp. novicida U112]AJI44656.1 major Facilitator Superfamily protein [Francisella tularensis subsp. novicida F6168]AJI61039.1 major Facilitator Superfamily protein [Francisella tularensis subsp. novicida U112]AJI73590.1 major Facilitator Superfamily protein [Francisella tularensis subsp. novicida D9876]AJJ48197.1 major Facilitator Superfamily protein [Francisella
MEQRIYNIRGYAWIIIILSSFLLFDKYVMQVFPSLITDDMMSNFGTNATQTGALGSAFFWSIIICQLFLAGPIIDKFGFRLISPISITISATGVILFVVAANLGSLSMAYIARITTGLGVSFATISYLKAVSVWFEPRKFAFAASFLATAAMIGALCAQAPLAYLITICGDWKMAMLLFSVASLLIAVVYYIVVRDFNPKQPEASSPNNQLKTLDALKEVIKNKNNWLLTFYVGLSFTAVDAFAGFWGNAYFREAYHISREEAASIISMIFIGMAIGSPIIGKLSEILDSRKGVMIFFHIIGTIALSFVLLTKTSSTISAILLFIFGLCLGIYMLSFAIGNRINPIIITATVAAFINTGEPILGAIFDPLIGYFLDWSWTGKYINKAGEVVSQYTSSADIKYFELESYHFAFTTLVASMIASLVILVMIKDKKD